MSNPRITAFRAMLAKNPDNARVRFGLATELLKEGMYEDAAAELRRYLAAADDEGNAHGRLAEALEKLGRADEARDALRQGIAAAHRFGHAGLANELEERLGTLEA
jgi:predicted Zn-dependent protease